MPRFSKAVGGFKPTEKPKPAKIVRLEPSHFAQTWDKRPAKAIAVGLRGVSDGDESVARNEAEKLVREEFEHIHPENAVDCFNDALMRGIVARGICDPNDANSAHPLFQLADEMIRFALTPQTIRYLFEELEKLQIETSPLHPEATDKQVERLSKVMVDAATWSRLPMAEHKQARRYLRFALELLAADELAEPELELAGMDPELVELLS